MGPYTWMRLGPQKKKIHQSKFKFFSLPLEKSTVARRSQGGQNSPKQKKIDKNSLFLASHPKKIKNHPKRFHVMGPYTSLVC